MASLPNLALTAGVLGAFGFTLIRMLERNPDAFMAQAENVPEAEADLLFTQPEGW